MSTVQHVRWISYSQEEKGRCALRHATFGGSPRGAFVELYPIHGAPPIGVLPKILDAGLGAGWRQEAESLHRSRLERWRVEEVYRTSGAADFLLRIVEDAELGDAPIIASLHVSCKRRLNRRLQVWSRDLPPLLAAVLKYLPEEGWAEIAPPHNWEDFKLPGSPSGLLGDGE